jgi:hypothetical protein
LIRDMLLIHYAGDKRGTHYDVLAGIESELPIAEAIL